MSEIYYIGKINPPEHQEQQPATTLVESNYTNVFRKNIFVRANIVQVVASVLVVVCQIIGIIYLNELDIFRKRTYLEGMYSGVLFGLSGLFGIWAGCQPSRCNVIAHMVLAILSCLSAITFILSPIFVSYHIPPHIPRGLYKFLFAIVGVLGLIQIGLSITTCYLSSRSICSYRQSLHNAFESQRPAENCYPQIFNKHVKLMSGAQIIASIITIILNIVAKIYPCVYLYPYTSPLGIEFGIWGAIIFVIVGGIVMWSTIKPSRCSLITRMVMAITSSCFAVLYLGISAKGIAASVEPMMGDYLKEKETARMVAIAVFVMQTLIAIINLMISITMSAISCKTICCPENDWEVQRANSVNTITIKPQFWFEVQSNK